MTHYNVTAPVAGYNGEVAGVRFYRGRATTDDSNRAALAYFGRRGYTVTPIISQPEPDAEPDEDGIADQVVTPEPDGEGAPERPADSANKPEWVTYVAATTDLSEAEADDLKKAALIELADKTTDENTETES